jgi:hypothetical protein
MDEMIDALGRDLYQAFWTRNGHETIAPFENQATAIQAMWRAIAADALGLMVKRAKTMLDVVDPSLFSNLTTLAGVADPDAFRAEFAKLGVEA